jgi:hypothetical protein
MRTPSRCRWTRGAGRSLLAFAVLALLGGCFASTRHVSSLPPTDRTLWNACRPTLARICRATFEPAWDTCLASKRADFVHQPSFEARRAFLLSGGCPPKVVNGATRRSREAVMPKAVDPASPGPAAKPSAPQAPPPGTPLPPSETPS